MKKHLSTLALTVFASVSFVAFAYAQAPGAPVVGSDDPAKLFTSSDPKLHANKQAAMHIVIDLLEFGHWTKEEASKWITPEYIQHNPGFASGLDTVIAAFGGGTRARPVTDPKSWTTKVVSVVAEGDYVSVATVRTVAGPPAYTTTHFDMWKFKDGKANEHWDEGTFGGGRGGGGGAGAGGARGAGGPGAGGAGAPGGGAGGAGGARGGGPGAGGPGGGAGGGAPGGRGGGGAGGGRGGAAPPQG